MSVKLCTFSASLFLLLTPIGAQASPDDDGELGLHMSCATDSEPKFEFQVMLWGAPGGKELPKTLSYAGKTEPNRKFEIIDGLNARFAILNPPPLPEGHQSKALYTHIMSTDALNVIAGVTQHLHLEGYLKQDHPPERVWFTYSYGAFKASGSCPKVIYGRFSKETNG